jgi:hypothetical protein
MVVEIQAENLSGMSLECGCYASQFIVQPFAVPCTYVQLLCTFTTGQFP